MTIKLQLNKYEFEDLSALNGLLHAEKLKLIYRPVHTVRLAVPNTLICKSSL